jgi:hypothetical protein
VKTEEGLNDPVAFACHVWGKGWILRCDHAAGKRELGDLGWVPAAVIAA